MEKLGGQAGIHPMMRAMKVATLLRQHAPSHFTRTLGWPKVQAKQSPNKCYAADFEQLLVY